MDTRLDINHMGANALKVENEGKDNEWTRGEPRKAEPPGENKVTVQEKRKTTTEISLPLPHGRTPKTVPRQQSTPGMVTSHGAHNHQGVRKGGQSKQSTDGVGKVDGSKT